MVWWILGGVVLAGALGSTLALAERSSPPSPAAWLCPGLANTLENGLADAVNATPGANDNASKFAAVKADGLLDMEKGIAWAKRGCNPAEDGGHLAPSLYTDMQKNGKIIRFSR